MSSMYETIMDLPLFKGTGTEQISAFLEKTHISFINYKDAETVVETGEVCDAIRQVISGKVSVKRKLKGTDIEIEQICGRGYVVGADRLFGIDPAFPYSAKAVGAMTLLAFGKRQYLSLLRSDEIFLLNYLNYLCLRSQRPRTALSEIKSCRLLDWLQLMVASLTDKEAIEIKIRGTEDALARLLGVTTEDLRKEEEKLAAESLITIDTDCIIISSRRNFLAAAI